MRHLHLAVPLLSIVALGLLTPVAAVHAAGEEADLLDDLSAPAPVSDNAPAAEPATSSSAGSSEGAGTGGAETIAAQAADATAPSAAPSEANRPAVTASAVDLVKAVPRKAILKRGRIELSMAPALSLNDAYYRHYAGSASLLYYAHDSFGIGVGADYMFAHLKTGSTDVIRLAMTAVPAVFEPPQLFAHVDMYWVPIYGKASVLGSSIAHFEIYATAGLGAASVSGGRWPLAANAGVGQRVMLSDWMALRFELRDHIFVDTQEVNGLTRSDIQSYMMFFAGLSFFVPPSFEYRIR